MAAHLGPLQKAGDRSGFFRADASRAMSESYTVTVEGEVSDKEAEKIRQAIQKSLGKWFKKGLDINVARD